MLTITKTRDITELDFPQPLYDSQKIATAQHTELGSFTIYAGLSKKYADDIKKYSLDKSDTALQEGTGDYKRFGESDYKERYKAKPRTQIILVHDESDEIASFVWLGPRDLPEDINILKDIEIVNDHSGESGIWFTSSYRTYGAYRGVGITKTFSQHVLALYKQLHPNTPMWLAVQTNNAPAIILYKKLGFKTIAKDKKEDEYVMKFI